MMNARPNLHALGGRTATIAFTAPTDIYYTSLHFSTPISQLAPTMYRALNRYADSFDLAFYLAGVARREAK